MQLNHLNLPVGDLNEARDFFQRCFAFQLVEQRGDAIAVMAGEGDFTLVLSNPNALKGGSPEYPPGFHVGFIVETPDHVDATYRHLVAADVQIDREPTKIRGSHAFYFTALGAILFEVSCPLP